MSTTDLIARAQQHTALRTELDRQGPLFSYERELLLEAADALFFEEPEAELRHIEARLLLEALEANDRRTPRETDRLRRALDGCAAAGPAIDPPSTPAVPVAA